MMIGKRINKLKDELLLLSIPDNLLIQLLQCLKTDGLPHLA